MLHGALILFVIILSVALFLQYAIGSSGMDMGTVLVEEKEKVISKDNYKTYDVKFNLNHNVFGFVSNVKMDIYLLSGNISPTSDLTYIQNNAFKSELQTTSWGYYFNSPTEFTVFIFNTEKQDGMYSVTFRDYTNAEYQKIFYKSIGTIVLYASFLPLIIYVLIRIFKKYSIIPIIFTLGGFALFVARKLNVTSYDKNNDKTKK